MCKEVFSASISWKGWDFSQIQQPSLCQWVGVQHLSAEQRLQALELTQLGGKLGGGTGGDSQLPRFSMYPRPPEHLWLPRVIPEYPTASQLARSQWQSEVPLCREAMGSTRQLEGRQATW